MLFDTLFELPDPARLYRALVERDERFEGRAYVCGATTGSFCRMTSPARKPLPENCTFRATIGECIEALVREGKVGRDNGRLQPIASRANVS